MLATFNSLENLLIETSLLDLIRISLIIAGTGLIGSVIGYAKRYARVQNKTGLGLSGSAPVFAIMGSYAGLVMSAMAWHVYRFNEPATPFLLVTPFLFTLGIWGAVKANHRMRDMYPEG